jgi:hypothetical protein
MLDENWEIGIAEYLASGGDIWGQKKMRRCLGLLIGCFGNE